MIEQWKKHYRYTNYEISTSGRFRRALDSPRRGGTFPGRELIPSVYTDPRSGYVLTRIGLYKNGRRRMKQVSIWILEAWDGPRPSRRHEASHLDGNETHNWRSNLAWETRRKNAKRGRQFRRGWTKQPPSTTSAPS